MNAPARIPVASAVLESADPAILSGVGQPGVGAAIWRRRRDADFAAWIDGLPAAQLPSLRTLVTAEAAGAAVHAACDSAGTPEGPQRDRLADDAAALAMILSQVAAQPLLEMRLDVVRDDKCRRFHVDRVRCRMLCAYRGAGSLYGAARPQGDPEAVHRLETGDAGLFRGAFWPGPEFTGIVHRSPPMTDDAGVRLLLVIDPADEDAGRC
jgi:hypothetical protein